MSLLFYFDQTSNRDIYYNLALEEAIGLNLGQGRYTAGVRFWKNPLSVVLGISDKVNENLPAELLRSFSQTFPNAKIPVARRCSGGGTVVHDINNLNYTIFVRLADKKELYPVKDSYEILLGLVRSALENQGIQSFFSGKSDLTIQVDSDKRKFSGNAQFRKKDSITHHGTLILDSQVIEEAARLLMHPPQEPDYRGKRSHASFLAPLPGSFDENKFKHDLFALLGEFVGEKNPHKHRLFSDKTGGKKIVETAKSLYTKKYKNTEYILRS